MTACNCLCQIKKCTLCDISFTPALSSSYCKGQDTDAETWSGIREGLPRGDSLVGGHGSIRRRGRIARCCGSRQDLSSARCCDGGERQDEGERRGRRDGVRDLNAVRSEEATQSEKEEENLL